MQSSYSWRLLTEPHETSRHLDVLYPGQGAIRAAALEGRNDVSPVQLKLVAPIAIITIVRKEAHTKIYLSQRRLNPELFLCDDGHGRFGRPGYALWVTM